MPVWEVRGGASGRRSSGRCPCPTGGCRRPRRSRGPGRRAGGDHIADREPPVGGEAVLGHVPGPPGTAVDAEQRTTGVGEETRRSVARRGVGEDGVFRLGEGAQQGPAGLGQRGDPPGGDAQQHRGVRIGRPHRVGDLRDPARGGVRALARVVLVLLPGGESDDRCHGQYGGQRAEECAGAASGGRRRPAFRFAGFEGGGEELPFRGGQLSGSLRMGGGLSRSSPRPWRVRGSLRVRGGLSRSSPRPWRGADARPPAPRPISAAPATTPAVRPEQLLRADQAGASVEGAGVAVVFQPGAGGLGEAAVVAEAFTVLVDPGAEARPAGDEGLVGELDAVLVDGDEPVAGQLFHHDRQIPVGPLVQFGAGQRAAGVGVALTGLDQAEEQAAGGTGLGRGQLAVRLFGGRRDGSADPARRLVRAQGQQSAAAPLPGLQQRVRQHRQRARLVEDLVHDPRGQLPLDQQPDRLGRSDDRLTQLVRAHGPDQQAGATQGLGQAAVFGAAGVEVGAYGDEHPQPALPVAGGEQHADEPVALRRVPAQGEDLLELVDDHPALRFPLLDGQQMPVRLGGPGPRGEHPQYGRAAVLRDLLPQAGYQPGAQQRRLAAPRRPEDHREPVRAHQLVQLLHQPVPAEEQRAVVRLEASEAPVRRCRVRRLLAHGARGLRVGVLPPGLPLTRVGAACPYVPLDHGERRQPLPRRRVGQRRRGEARRLGHRAVRRPARGPAQLPQLVREPLHGTGVGIDGSFRTPHGTTHFRPLRARPRSGWLPMIGAVNLLLARTRRKHCVPEMWRG